MSDAAAVIAPTVKLNNGRDIPVLGLGTWLMERTEAVDLVKKAIDVGYRHFDTAMIYHTEKPIGEAIREKIEDGTVTRDELFITSKLWCTYAHPGLVVKACQKSLKNLGLDYLDLYLIHWPIAFKAPENPDNEQSGAMPDIETFLASEYFPRDSSGKVLMTADDYLDTWREMEKCVEMGLAKSIGVSNFNSKQIERILQEAAIRPVVNQVEVHPYLNQKKLVDFCKDREITVTCYGPLGASFPPKNANLPKMMDHPIIVKIAREKKKSPAQVSLRYLIQRGTVVIPKTSNPKRLLENISIFDFSLSPQEMSEIDKMNCNERIYCLPDSEHHKYYPFSLE